MAPAPSRKDTHRHFFLLLAAGVTGAVCMDTRRASHAWHFPRLASSQDLQLLLVCALSLVCDYVVLGYHASTPPHPKFRISFARRFSLAVHVISGCIEIWASTVAWFAADPTPLARVAVAAAFLGHIPSAVHQLPIVFGVKAITIPCYVVFVAIHIYAATMLALAPSDPVALLKLSAALHGYVWVRMSIGVFKRLGIFASHEYTIAILCTGFLMIPPILGPASNFCLALSALLFYYLLYPLLLRSGVAAAAWRSNTEEYSRETVVVDEGRKRAALQSLASRALSCSDLFSQDGTGTSLTDCHTDAYGSVTPDRETPTSMLAANRNAQELALRVTQRLDEASNGLMGVTEPGPITPRTTAWLMADRVRALAGGLRDNMSDAEKAHVVFQALDCDDRGSISVKELGDVLTSWALPEGEAAQYMRRMDTDGNGRLDLSKFTIHLRPMWEYGFELLVAELEASKAALLAPELLSLATGAFSTALAASARPSAAS